MAGRRRRHGSDSSSSSSNPTTTSGEDTTPGSEDEGLVGGRRRRVLRTAAASAQGNAQQQRTDDPGSSQPGGPVSGAGAAQASDSSNLPTRARPVRGAAAKVVSYSEPKYEFERTGHKHRAGSSSEGGRGAQHMHKKKRHKALEGTASLPKRDGGARSNALLAYAANKKRAQGDGGGSETGDRTPKTDVPARESSSQSPGRAASSGSDADSEEEEEDPEEEPLQCTACGKDTDQARMLCCDCCEAAFHTYCLAPPLARVPKGDWLCPSCTELRELDDVERLLAVRVVPASTPVNQQLIDTLDGDVAEEHARARHRQRMQKLGAAGPAGLAAVAAAAAAAGAEAPGRGPEAADGLGAPTQPAPASQKTPARSGGATAALSPRRAEGRRAGDTPPGPASGPQRREYLVKWKGFSHLHCRWLPAELVTKAADLLPGLRQRLARFSTAQQPQDGPDLEGEDVVGEFVHGVNTQWLVVDRVLAEAQRPVEPPPGLGPFGAGSATPPPAPRNATHFLVKWAGLTCEACTWEPEGVLRDHEGEVAAFRARRPIQELAAERRAKKAAASANDPPSATRSARDVKHEDDDAPQAGQPEEAAGLGSGVRRFRATPAWLAESGGALHPYQLEGLNWLFHKWRTRENVILADEMGLGKTVQAVALLAAQHQEECLGAPSLVVAPLSTLKNWEREFAAWAPYLNVVTLAGPAPARKVILEHELFAEPPEGVRRSDRASVPARIKFDVLLTSYEGVLVESSTLQRIPCWATLVVDEGHRLKNKASRLFMELARVAATFRLLLTGTPLQNNLTELFMLMHFLDPVKFSSQEAFEGEFSDLSGEEKISKLHAQLEPHLLRRLKKDVLKRLPPKQEQVVPVELSDLQKRVYKQLLERHYPVLMEGGKGSVGGGGGASSTTTKLKNLVMELRKCCNHPYLFDGIDSGLGDPAAALSDLVAASGKLALMDRLLPRLAEQGHRILIYSQFTSVLDILEEWLAGRGWPMLRIDGNVTGPERQRRIDAFNSSTTYRVFLLSTRAGGVGINLATADTVVIHDSDWNPHNDLQAQARAHRLGQTQPVMIYRLISRGSVEERMLQVSRKKLLLEHVVVQQMGDKGSKGAGLSHGELNDILRYGVRELFHEDTEGGQEAGSPAPGGQGSLAPAAPPPVIGSGQPAAESAPGPTGGVAAASDGAGPMEVDAADVAANGTSSRVSQPRSGPNAASGAESGPAVELNTKPSSGKGGAGAVAAGGPAKAPSAPPRPPRKIVYDDAALERLLDRSELAAKAAGADGKGGAAEEEQEDAVFKGFKVAHFDMVVEEAAVAEQAVDAADGADLERTKRLEELAREVCPEQEEGLPPKQFWAELLGDKAAAAHEAELAARGRGKRERAQVQYREAHDSDDSGGGMRRRRRRTGFDGDDDREFVADDDGAGSTGEDDEDVDGLVDEELTRIERRGRGRGAGRLPGSRGRGRGTPVMNGSLAPPHHQPPPNAAPARNAVPDASGAVATGTGDNILGLDSRDRAVFIHAFMRFGLPAEGTETGLAEALRRTKIEPADLPRLQDLFAPFTRRFPSRPLPVLIAYCQLLVRSCLLPGDPKSRVFANGIHKASLLGGTSHGDVLKRMHLMHLIRRKVADAQAAGCFSFRPALLDIAFQGSSAYTTQWTPVQDYAMLRAALAHGFNEIRMMLSDQEFGLEDALRAAIAAGRRSGPGDGGSDPDDASVLPLAIDFLSARFLTAVRILEREYGDVSHAVHVLQAIAMAPSGGLAGALARQGPAAPALASHGGSQGRIVTSVGGAAPPPPPPPQPPRSVVTAAATRHGPGPQQVPPPPPPAVPPRTVVTASGTGRPDPAAPVTGVTGAMMAEAARVAQHYQAMLAQHEQQLRERSARATQATHAMQAQAMARYPSPAASSGGARAPVVAASTAVHVAATLPAQAQPRPQQQLPPPPPPPPPLRAPSPGVMDSHQAVVGGLALPEVTGDLKPIPVPEPGGQDHSAIYTVHRMLAETYNNVVEQVVQTREDTAVASEALDPNDQEATRAAGQRFRQQVQGLAQLMASLLQRLPPVGKSVSELVSEAHKRRTAPATGMPPRHTTPPSAPPTKLASAPTVFSAGHAAHLRSIPAPTPPPAAGPAAASAATSVDGGAARSPWQATSADTGAGSRAAGSPEKAVRLAELRRLKEQKRRELEELERLTAEASEAAGAGRPACPSTSQGPSRSARSGLEGGGGTEGEADAAAASGTLGGERRGGLEVAQPLASHPLPEAPPGPSPPAAGRDYIVIDDDDD